MSGFLGSLDRVQIYVLANPLHRYQTLLTKIWEGLLWLRSIVLNLHTLNHVKSFI